jgi:hypothetical protein
VVGNGSSLNSRSNALTLLKNGDLTIAGSLDVQGDAGALMGGTFGSGTIPATGGGTRFMWYPGKAALRAGHVVSTAWDDSSVAPYSAALGRDSTASGHASFAAGNGATASGSQSIALGGGTTASGTFSAALGGLTIASGYAATAIGVRTDAHAYGSLALGRYNTTRGSQTSWVSGDPVLVVGNGGSASNRSDALVLEKDGDLTIAGTLTENSDRRLKTDVTALGGVLRKLSDVRGVTYRFKDEDTHPAGKQIGLVAQEVRTAFPELVHQAPDGTLSVAYGKFVAVLVEAVKEQQEDLAERDAEVRSLERRVGDLTERLARLEARLGRDD